MFVTLRTIPQQSQDSQRAERIAYELSLPTVPSLNEFNRSSPAFYTDAQPSRHAKERRGGGNLTKLIPPISPTFSSDPTERFTLLKDRGELTSQRESRSGGIGGVSERVTEQTSFACCHRYVSTWPGGVQRPVFSFRSRLQGTAARLMHGI